MPSKYNPVEQFKKNCKYCKKEFVGQQSKIYCSKICNNLNNRDKMASHLSLITKKCLNCQKSFNTRISYQVYCSSKCHNLSRKWNIWRDLREYIQERDNFTCQKCGFQAKTHADIDVDHIIPLYKGGKHTSDNLQVLCQKCHKEKHKIK